jgi:hypothetical protein
MPSSSVEEQILKASKEIIVKFIEVGRVSPAAFPEAFKTIYAAVEETVKATHAASGETADPESRDVAKST